MVCKNCTADFSGQYCNVCGQKVTERLATRSVGKMLFDDIFEVDRGLFFTLKQLWILPGATALDYIRGRTKRYYSPVKFLLLWTAVYLILSSFLDANQESKSLQAILFNPSPPFSSAAIDDFFMLYFVMIVRHIDVFYLGLTPFLVIISLMIYRKWKYNFAELSVLYLYILGQIIFVIACATFILYFIHDKFAGIVFAIPLSLIVLYLIIRSHKQFFGESWIKSIFKSLVVLYLGQMLYLVISFVVLNILKAIFQ